MLKVDSNPEAAVIDELNGAVEGATRAALVLNPELVRFERFHDMALDDITSGFEGRDGKLYMMSNVLALC
jgi:hypothetical protein